MPVPDTEAKGPASSNMKTNPQMEFTAKDFAKFGEFDTDGSNPYGIEMPGKPGKLKKTRLILTAITVLPWFCPGNLSVRIPPWSSPVPVRLPSLWIPHLQIGEGRW